MQWYEYIIQGLFVIVSAILGIFFTYKTSNEKVFLTSKNILIVILGGCLCVINNIFSYQGVRLLGNYLILICIFRLLQPSNIKNLTFNYTLLMIYGLIIEASVILLSVPIFGKEGLNNFSFAEQALLILIIYVVWFGTWKYFFNIIASKVEKIKKIIFNIFNFEIVFILLFATINIIMSNYYLDLKRLDLVLLFIIILNATFLIMTFIIKNKYFQENLKIKNKTLEENIRLYEQVAEDYRIMKHNLIGDLMMVKPLCNKSGQEVINQKIINYKKDYEWITNINNVPEGIKGILYIKKEEAKRSKVKIIIESNYSEQKLKPKEYLGLCEVLDIVINNAIEAARNSKNKIVKIEISGAKELEVKITNPFSNDIDITKLGEKDYSTKNRDSGIGLYSVIKKEQKKLKIKNEIIGDLFISKIKLAI